MPAAPQLKEVKHTQEVTYLYFDNGGIRETLGFLNYFFLCHLQWVKWHKIDHC